MFEILPCRAEDLEEDDVVVILIGLSGSGKSNFIEQAAGNTHLGLTRTGESIRPFTQGVQGFRFKRYESFGNRLVLVDTPGLDSAEGVNGLIKNLDSWLKKPISDGRTTCDPYQYLSVISNKYPRTTKLRLGTVTTMWDKEGIHKDIKEARDCELRRSGWRKMVKNVMDQQFRNTTQSAHDILLLAAAGNSQPVASQPPQTPQSIIKQLKKHVSDLEKEKKKSGRVDPKIDKLIKEYKDLLKNLKAGDGLFESLWSFFR